MLFSQSNEVQVVRWEKRQNICDATCGGNTEKQNPENPCPATRRSRLSQRSQCHNMLESVRYDPVCCRILLTYSCSPAPILLLAFPRLRVPPLPSHSLDLSWHHFSCCHQSIPQIHNRYSKHVSGSHRRCLFVQISAATSGHTVKNLRVHFSFSWSALNTSWSKIRGTSGFTVHIQNWHKKTYHAQQALAKTTRRYVFKAF